LSSANLKNETFVRIFLTDYYDNYFTSPWFLDYNICEGDFCMEKKMWVDVEKKTKVPNTELMLYDDYDYNLVGSEGVLSECAPGLTIQDLAEWVLPCYEIEGGFDTWTYIEACQFSRLGWLQQDTTVNVGKLDSISGLSDQVKQCTSAEKTKGKQITRTTNKGTSNKRSGKGRGRRVLKRNKGNRKRKGRKSSRDSKRGKKAFKRRLPRAASRELQPKGKKRRSKRKNNTEDKKEQKKEKKKKKREEKQILNSIQLDSVPTKETMDQLYCIRHAVYRGLTDCARDLISENLIDSRKYNCSC